MKETLYLVMPAYNEEANIEDVVRQWHPVAERINAEGGITSITTKWTQSHKETKIQMNAPWVKQHCLFRAEDTIQGKMWSEYRLFLRQLCTYSMRGKNKNDDAPDAMAQLAIWQTKASTVQKVKLGKRWF